MKSLFKFNLAAILSVVLLVSVSYSATLMPAVDISGGEDHTLVLGGNFQAFSWGDNGYDQLGLGDQGKSYEDRLVHVHGPNDISFLNGISDIAAGWQYSLVLDVNGTVWAWRSYTKSLSNRVKAVLGFTPHAFDQATNSITSTRLLEVSQL